tara:strand:+ start:364 stop:1587 length:1224 start_codon:yes stop_codon:yes gene_type:complete
VSLFRVHNELINVWTELLPAAFFAVWTYHFLQKHAAAPKEDRHVGSVGRVVQLPPRMALLSGSLPQWPCRLLHTEASHICPLHLPVLITAPPPRYIVGAGLALACIVRPLCSGLAHLFYCTSMSGYIVWWSVDYISICFAILASSIVSGRMAFYCLPPLQILFFTSTAGATRPHPLSGVHPPRDLSQWCPPPSLPPFSSAGLLSSSLVAVLSISSASLRAASFVLFVLFCNGVPFCYTVGVKLATGSRYHQDVPWEYVQLCAGAAKVAVLAAPHLASVGASGCARRLGAALRTREGGLHTSDHSELPLPRSQAAPKTPFFAAFDRYRWAASLGTFVLGLGVKQMAVPERLFRSWFTDVFFASHQLWHVAINVGFTLGTFYAWDVYLVWRNDNMCPSSDDALGGGPQL